MFSTTFSPRISVGLFVGWLVGYSWLVGLLVGLMVVVVVVAMTDNVRLVSYCYLLSITLLNGMHNAYAYQVDRTMRSRTDGICCREPLSLLLQLRCKVATTPHQWLHCHHHHHHHHYHLYLLAVVLVMISLWRSSLRSCTLSLMTRRYQSISNTAL